MPSFLDDTANILANPSTRQTPLFAILIAAKDAVFSGPFTRTPGERERESVCVCVCVGIDQIRFILSRDYGLHGGSGKMAGAGHDFWRILPKSRPFHRLARRPSFSILIADKDSIFLAPFTHIHGVS